ASERFSMASVMEPVSRTTAWPRPRASCSVTSFRSPRVSRPWIRKTLRLPWVYGPETVQSRASTTPPRSPLSSPGAKGPSRTLPKAGSGTATLNPRSTPTWACWGPRNWGEISNPRPATRASSATTAAAIRAISRGLMGLPPRREFDSRRENAGPDRQAAGDGRHGAAEAPRRRLYRRSYLPRGRDANRFRGRRHRERSLRQLLDGEVAELHQAGRAVPAAEFGVPGAVVLQGERPLAGDPGQLGVGDDLLAVELHPQAVALQGDLERVPLAARPVHALLRRDAGPDLRRPVLVPAVP